MSTANVCPQCGKPLPSDGPQGQCPACLLKAALPGQSSLGPLDTRGATLDASSPPGIAEAGMRLQYFGDYELLEEIARGGMGVVWKARQTSLKRDVALKMIRAGALAGPEEVERFLREAEAAANLQHPNIVAIHEVGEHGGQHYFSMDLVVGRDLGALVKEDGPLSAPRAARYVKTIAEAIQFAHQRGVLHRDLKPQNVLIDAADQPRITDFGLAKLMKEDSRLTQSGVVMGSPSYMPPEQAAGRLGDVGPASDVYSLGAMLYELLTGRPPFRGASAMATLRYVMENEPVELRRLKADVPPDLETICLKCLEKSPAARYPTARALAEELDRFLRGEPIQGRPASAVRKVVSWARRHTGILAGAAAIVMVTLAFGVFYLLEENAFLRAKQADPTLERKSGVRHLFLKEWSLLFSLTPVAGIYVWLFVRMRALRLSLADWFNPAKHARPFQPLGERMRAFAIGMGLAVLGSGILLLVAAIQAHVWEGESIVGSSIIGQILSIYASVYFGLATLAMVVQDYRLLQYGAASRQLTAEQIEPIRRAMEDWDVKTAMNHYREAIPDATLAEAGYYVTELANSLKGKHPGKFVPPPLTLATLLNWKLLSIGAMIEAVLLGIISLVVQPADPAVFLGSFAGAGLAGMLWIGPILLMQRVQDVGKRMLLLVPVGLVSMVAVFVLMIKADSMEPYVLGSLFGGALAGCGFTRQYRQRDPKAA